MSTYVEQSNHRTRWIAIAILLSVVALLPRVYDLDALSFYGDEETTAMPSLAAASGQGPTMPSGMPYYRALPHTFINAVVLQFSDRDSESSYRIVSALLGAATIGVFFLGVRAFFGLPVALVASALLLLSDWHIMVSREGRMYAPFVLAYLSTAWSILSWVLSGRRSWLIAALVAYSLTITLHALGLFVLAFLLIPAVLSIRQRVNLLACISFFALLAVLGYCYDDFFVLPAFSEWGPDGQITRLPSVNKDSGSVLSVVLPLAGKAWSAFVVVGVILGGLIGWRLRDIAGQTNSVATAVILVLSVCFAIFATIGQLYGAVCFAAALFFVVPERTAWTDRRVLLPSAIAGMIVVAWAAYAWQELGLIDGIKVMLSFPFPYLLTIGSEMPGVMVLLFFGILAAAIGNRTTRAAYGIVVLAILGPVLAIGVLSEWGGRRYLIHIYPFMLIIAAYGAVSLTRYLLGLIRDGWKRFALPVALLLVIAGVDFGHGVWSSYLVTRANYALFPDHRSAGHYVKARVRGDDVIVAEDALQQKWYVGRVDYWLRAPATHRSYMYYDEGGVMRDIYVASRVLSAADIDRLEAETKRVWVITSWETAAKPEYYLDDAQRNWLGTLRRTEPLYIARDGVTAVYCLHCSIDGD